MFLLAAEAFLQENEPFLFAKDAYRIEFSPEVAGISRCGENQVALILLANYLVENSSFLPSSSAFQPSSFVSSV